ncbi:MAG TPA: hypothetical protein VM033_00305 [Gemmatimonadaceae bacterium]|nr:hypothetical protein [Gemmatimonadaceae bacterium]
MRNHLRLTIASVALLGSAACSRSSEQPALSDDLKQDIARAGGSDVQMAGSSNGRVDVVSAAERTNGAVASPKSPTVTRAPSAVRGRTAVARSPRPVSPAAAEPSPRATETAPAQVYTEEPAPAPVPAQSRPRAPQPSTQREPPGGWRTPGQIIRNAPFPINP